MSILSAICNLISPWNRFKVLDVESLVDYLRRSDQKITVKVGLLEDWDNSVDTVFVDGAVIMSADPAMSSSIYTPVFYVVECNTFHACWKYSNRPLFWASAFKKRCQCEEKSRLF